MVTFVGAEYVIANALIALKRKGINFITFESLREIGFKLQGIFNEQGLNAVILTSGDSISVAIVDFSDYFQYKEIDDAPAIVLYKDATITDLENRFVGYLPVDVLCVLIKEIDKIVA